MRAGHGRLCGGSLFALQRNYWSKELSDERELYAGQSVGSAHASNGASTNGRISVCDGEGNRTVQLNLADAARCV